MLLVNLHYNQSLRSYQKNLLSNPSVTRPACLLLPPELVAFSFCLRVCSAYSAHLFIVDLDRPSVVTVKR